MIVIDSEDILEVGKTYTGVWIKKKADSEEIFYDQPYKIIRQATQEEYITSCLEDEIDPVPFQ